MLLSVNYQVVPMVFFGLTVWSVLGFLIIPFFKAGVMRRMGWASFKNSFKHGFWINILLVPIVLWDATTYFQLRLPLVDYSADERVITAYFAAFFLSATLILIVEAAILSVLLFALNKTEPYRFAWRIATFTNIPYFIFLFFKLLNVFEVLL